ncbi:MAG: hypothetical protein BWY76_02398 [bacterium ADurb.Bin429]|nr:MAG: hypothetical protein BWY76_02398 [bacterium ADurb.Bin429]
MRVPTVASSMLTMEATRWRTVGTLTMMATTRMAPASSTPQAARVNARYWPGTLPIIHRKTGMVTARPTHAARAWVSSSADSITSTAPSSAARRFGHAAASAAPTPSGMSMAR